MLTRCIELVEVRLLPTNAGAEDGLLACQSRLRTPSFPIEIPLKFLLTAKFLFPAILGKHILLWLLQFSVARRSFSV